MFSIDDVLYLAIQIEENGEKLLRNAQKKTTNPELQTIFKWQADEEGQHIKSFSNLNPSLEKTADIPELETMGRGLLRDILGEESFSLKDVDLSKIEGTETLILRMIEFENDTALFYEMIRSVVSDPKTIAVIDEIISQEKQHAQTLEQFLDTVYAARKSG
jgi:rubrerythrin